MNRYQVVDYKGQCKEVIYDFVKEKEFCCKGELDSFVRMHPSCFLCY